jgi:hypothetical protein
LIQMASVLDLEWVWEQLRSKKYLTTRAGNFNLKIFRKKDNRVDIHMIPAPAADKTDK